MATGNGRSDSRVGEGGRLDQRRGGEVQPGDDRRDAKMASPSLSHEASDEVLFTGTFRDFCLHG